MLEFLESIKSEIVVGLIVTPLGAWLGDLRSKRKASAEAKSQELDNVEKGLSIYKDMIDTLRKEMQDQHDRNATEIEGLKKKLDDVEASWKKKYDDLKKQFELYKKEHP